MRSRFEVRDRVARLDPAVDYEEIYRSLATVEFPWDVTRALELALYRTFAVPTIAALLDETGEFRLRTQKRYDDTVLLLSGAMEAGLETPEGRALVSRINRIHARFAIGNDDLLYTLGTFVFVPLRWIDRFGWRPLLPVQYYRRLGALMGIHDVPASMAAFEQWLDDFEVKHFAYGAAQERTAVATRELLVSWFPGALAPALRLGVHALLDAPVRATFGFPDPPRWLPPVIHGLLRTRARVERHLPPRRRPTVGAESRFVKSALRP